MLFPGKVKVALAGLAVAGGAAAAAIGPAGPAVGQASGPIQIAIQVNSPGTLVAKGAGVNVTGTASCSGPLIESATVQIVLTERVGRDIATGAAATGIDCTGTVQSFEVLVGADSAGKAFAKGTAIAQGTIYACQPDSGACASTQVAPTIKIRK